MRAALLSMALLGSVVGVANARPHVTYGGRGFVHRGSRVVRGFYGGSYRGHSFYLGTRGGRGYRWGYHGFWRHGVWISDYGYYYDPSYVGPRFYFDGGYVPDDIAPQPPHVPQRIAPAQPPPAEQPPQQPPQPVNPYEEHHPANPYADAE
jgi:hypothetical protein